MEAGPVLSDEELARQLQEQEDRVQKTRSGRAVKVRTCKEESSDDESDAPKAKKRKKHQLDEDFTLDLGAAGSDDEDGLDDFAPDNDSPTPARKKPKVSGKASGKAAKNTSKRDKVPKAANSKQKSAGSVAATAPKPAPKKQRASAPAAAVEAPGVPRQLMSKPPISPSTGLPLTIPLPPHASAGTPPVAGPAAAAATERVSGTGVLQGGTSVGALDINAVVHGLLALSSGPDAGAAMAHSTSPCLHTFDSLLDASKPLMPVTNAVTANAMSPEAVTACDMRQAGADLGDDASKESAKPGKGSGAAGKGKKSGAGAGPPTAPKSGKAKGASGAAVTAKASGGGKKDTGTGGAKSGRASVAATPGPLATGDAAMATLTTVDLGNEIPSHTFMPRVVAAVPSAVPRTAAPRPFSSKATQAPAATATVAAGPSSGGPASGAGNMFAASALQPGRYRIAGLKRPNKGFVPPRQVSKA